MAMLPFESLINTFIRGHTVALVISSMKQGLDKMLAHWKPSQQAMSAFCDRRIAILHQSVNKKLLEKSELVKCHILSSWLGMLLWTTFLQSKGNKCVRCKCVLRYEATGWEGRCRTMVQRSHNYINKLLIHRPHKSRWLHFFPNTPRSIL